MARIRSAKPDFWTDPLMCALSRDVRFTFKGIWEVCADDEGRFLADVRVIKGKVWPLDDDVTLKKIERYLQELAGKQRIHLYEVLGVRYGFVINWFKHQKISHPTPSIHPAPNPDPFPNGSGTIPETIRSDSDVSGAEGIREERKGSGAEYKTAPPESLARTLDLPKGAVDLLAMCYEPALTERQRERYRDVAAQLWETVDPKHPGPKIRGGKRVKAQSLDHLDFVCRRVITDPPINRDMAVVFVLNKLLDPLPGPTPAEKHKAETDAAVAKEEAYHRAAKLAGVRWARDHPEEYEPITAEVDALYRGKPETPFTRMARESQLIQRCAKAAGFPDFATWILQPENAA
jgi:hypothetical protein